ncbi:DUF1707 SHOCT-like domain-containing protein [Planomonospora algeriensis]
MTALDPVLRASDADRDRVAALLGEALATGRLTSVEHADRLEAAYTAVTVGELAPLTRDLPDVAAPAAALTTERQEVAAVFSKVVRGGRWVASRHTALRAVFGALIVDLSDAVLPGREITLAVDSYCAKLIVRVPPAPTSSTRSAPCSPNGTSPVARATATARSSGSPAG